MRPDMRWRAWRGFCKQRPVACLAQIGREIKDFLAGFPAVGRASLTFWQGAARARVRTSRVSFASRARDVPLSSPTMPEARFHPRLRVPVQADVIGAEVVLWRALEDLSLGGCKLAGPAWEEAGAAVSLVLSFPAIGPTSASMPLTGVVVRAGPRDLAIRFQAMSDEQRATLRKHIQDSQDAVAGG